MTLGARPLPEHGVFWMPENPFETKLDSVSVVIVAREHNPAIVSEEFLKKNGIVPRDWETVDNQPVFTTPAYSVVSFKNGVLWDVNPTICTISERVEGGFKDSYLTRESAKKFVETLPHVPYLAVGINWHIFFEFKTREKLLAWVKGHFLKEGGWQGRTNLVHFGFRIGTNCTFSLETDKDPKDKISVICNFHTDISKAEDKARGIFSAIDDLQENQKTLRSNLDQYFNKELT